MKEALDNVEQSDDSPLFKTRPINEVSRLGIRAYDLVIKS